MSNPTDTPAADLPDAAEQAPAPLGRSNALAIKAAVADRNKTVADHAHRVATAAFAAELGRGATRVAVSPLDPEQHITQVTVSAATYSAKVTSRSRADAWVVENYVEKTEEKTRIKPGFEAAALAALQDLAPYLVETVRVVPDHVIQELVLKSKLAHQPMGWGGEVGKEDGPPGIEVELTSPRIVITHRNPSLIDDLILQGVIDHEGNVLTVPAEPEELAVGEADPAPVAAPAPVFLSLVGGE